MSLDRLPQPGNRPEEFQGSKSQVIVAAVTHIDVAQADPAEAFGCARSQTVFTTEAALKSWLFSRAPISFDDAPSSELSTAQLFR
jgi:hypothetical protein